MKPRARSLPMSLRRALPANPRVSIVVPARNEAMNLREILPALPDVHEIIVVDGNSCDDTLDVVPRVRKNVRVIKQTRSGKGNAIVCGFAAATGDIIVMFDADGSADPAEIPAFVQTIVDGADLAKGTRFRAGGGSADITRFRSAGNRGLNIIANLLLGTRYTDLCYGYNAVRASILPQLELPDPDLPAIGPGRMHWGDGFEIETVLNCRIAALGLRVVEVPSFERPRIHGLSNLNAVSDGFRVLKTILDEKRRARAHLASLRPFVRASLGRVGARPRKDAA